MAQKSFFSSFKYSEMETELMEWTKTW